MSDNGGKIVKTMGVVHFSVTGEFITRHSRDRYIESGNLEAAISWLQSVMISPDTDVLDKDMAKAIIKGSKQFVGKDEFDIVDDDKEIVPCTWIRPVNIEDCYEAGFIAPNGKFYGVNGDYSLKHLYLAEEIYKTIEDDNFNYESHSIDYNLELNGYIRLRNYNNVMLSPTCEQKVTEEQMRAIVKLSYALKNTQCRKLMRFGQNGNVELTPYQLNNLEPLMWNKHLKTF